MGVLKKQEITLVSVVILTAINMVAVIPVVYFLMFLFLEPTNNNRFERSFEHVVDKKTKIKRIVGALIALIYIGVFGYMCFRLTMDIPISESNKYCLWTLPSFVNELLFVQIFKTIIQYLIIKSLTSGNLPKNSPTRNFLLKIANPGILTVFKE